MDKDKLQTGFMSDLVELKNLVPEDTRALMKAIKDSSKDDKVFKKIQEEKTKSLQAAVEDIKKLIDQREKLSSELLADMDKIKFEIGNIITKVATELGGVESKKEQIMLKQKQVEIEEVKVQEKLNCWRDIATLKQELREREQELKEKEMRMEVLDELVGEA